MCRSRRCAVTKETGGFDDLRARELSEQSVRSAVPVILNGDVERPLIGDETAEERDGLRH